MEKNRQRIYLLGEGGIKLVPDNVLEEIKSHWRDILPADNSGKGVTCPICGNGSKGKDGDGLRETPTPTVLKCFKCDFAGDVIKAVQEANHYTFYEAVKYCADQLGINYDDEKGDGYKSKPIPKPPTPSPTPIKKRVPETDYLRNGFFREAEKHLEETDYWKHRGLSLETAKHFKLGFVKDWTNPVGGFSKPSPRLIIPTSRFSYLARDIRKNLTDFEKKFTKIKVSSVRMFNADEALKHEITFVVEGEIDAMSIYEVGYNALALGSTSNKKMLIDRLKNPEMECGTKIFILALDNDDAGKKTSEWLEKELAAINFPYIVSNITGDYKDANDYLIANREGLSKAVADAAESAKKELENPTKPEEKANKVEEARPVESGDKKGSTDKPAPSAKTSKTDKPKKEDKLSLKEKAAKLEEITGSLSSKSKKETTQIALNYDTLRLADSIANTEYHYVFADFRNRVKDLKIIGMQEFDRQINIAAGRGKKLDNGAVGEGRSTQQIFPDCPINLTIPHNFVFEDGGIFNHKLEVASYTPIVVTRIFENLDENNSQKYEIQYRDNQSGIWKKIIADKSCFADSKKIVGLSDSGLDVTTYSAKVLIPFISAMVTTNKGKIPVVNSYTQPGWKGKGFKKFIYPPSDENYILDSADVDVERTFTIKGDSKEWLKYYEEAINYKYFRLIFGFSLLAPITELFSLRNMMAHLFGRSGGGKTAAIKLAASAFADPKYYIQNFNATHNFIIRIAVSFNNLPFFINELQAANNKNQMEALKNLPYWIEEGKERGRLNKDIKTRKKYYFSTIAITTGENPFTSSSSEMGAKARVLEFGDKEILPDGFAQDVHVFLQSGNHGHFGKSWINFVMEDVKNINLIKKTYDDFLSNEEIKKAYESKIPSHRNFIIAGLVCNMFFQIHFCKVDPQKAKREAIEIALEFAEEVQDKRSLTDTQRALRSIKSNISEMKKHFMIDNMGVGDVKGDDIYGIIDTSPNGFVAFYPDVLKDKILKAKDFNPDKIIKELAKEGYIARGDGRNLTTKVNGERCYKFPNKKLNQVYEGDDEEDENPTQSDINPT